MTSANKIVYSQFSDVVPMLLKDDNDHEKNAEGKQRLINETTQATKAALDKIVRSTIVPSDVEYIKYTPFDKSSNFNSGANARVIGLVEMPVDVLEPPKFKHKRVPKGSNSPPVPITCSPPRPVTMKDHQDWKIPPCVSSWKNPKGYTIPLEQRLGADGGVLNEVQINGKFSEFSAALYVAEEKAREAVVMRMKVQKERVMQEKEKKEVELRELARKARLDKLEKGSMKKWTRDVCVETMDETEERLYRDDIREERRRERKRGRIMDAKHGGVRKKSTICRDRDRDISESIVLGMADNGGRGVEVMYDQRLFNQDKGMSSGFANDDSYNIYERELFSTRSSMCASYKPKKEMDDEMYGGENEQLEKLRKTERFKPGRERPVEFENDEKSNEDIFGLGKFMTDMKTGKKSN